MDVYSASSLKQQFAGRYIVLLRHIILNSPVSAVTPLHARTQDLPHTNISMLIITPPMRLVKFDNFIL